MGALGVGRKHITLRTTEEKHAYVFLRASKVPTSVADFGGDLLDWWLAQGAPPVNKYDKTIKVPHFRKVRKSYRLKPEMEEAK